ncbi:MAG TPA: hypothetical protein VGW12_15780 [Pyrinomonadaceae bacterium]|nr:hypothetical protein [Pyrinomonadaceae bacterium]
MKKFLFSTTFAAFILAAVSITAFAQQNWRHYPLNSQEPSARDGRLRARPGVYDPDRTGIIVSEWRNGIGLPDDRGNTNFALYLAKNGSTGINAAAGVLIDGIEGLVVSPTTVFGYDIKDGGQCSAGAPRFNVITDTGALYFVGGCTYGTRTDLGGGWTRVTFTAADAFNATSGQQTGIPAGETIIFTSLVFDEGTDQGPGFAILDNININNSFITKPGAANPKRQGKGNSR